MVRQGPHIVLSIASAFAPIFFVATTCHASLTVPAFPDFNEEHLLAEQNDNLGPSEGGMSPEQHDALPAPGNLPTDFPLNPIRLTARKGLIPTGSSSSSSSSSSPSFGSGGLTLCDIATDPASVADGEQSVRLYADAAIFIPSAVQSRLFRPPRVA